MSTDTSSAEFTLAQVHENWGPLLREQTGEQLREIKVLRILDRPYSTTSILEAITDRGTQRVVFKQISEHPLNESVVDDPHQAAVEFRVLEKLYPHFTPIDRCAVPRPLLLLSECNAYLMEHVDGHVLADRLYYVHHMSDRSEFNQLQQHFYDSGQWLSHFHSICGRRLAPLTAIDNIVTRCHDRLQRIEGVNRPGVPSNFRQLATRFIDRQLDSLSGTEVLVTGRHGDFGPWNALAGPGGVTVIDFFGYREDPLPVDILSMLVFLESQEFGLANSVRRVRSLRERFLAGLGPLPELPKSLILLCEAQQRVLQIAGCVLNSRQEMLGRWERFKLLRKNIRWFLSPPEKSSLWPR